MKFLRGPRLPLLALGAGLLAVIGFTASAEPPRNVLALYAYGRLVPANTEADRELRKAISSSPDRPVFVFDEFLDAPAFGGSAYHRVFAAYLREKYSSRKPDVLVAFGREALEFFLDTRPDLFPGAPIVHGAVVGSGLRSRLPLPADVFGVPVEYDFEKTVDQALRWHPRARRLVIVTGSSAWDREWEARLREAAVRFRDRASAEFLSGLPAAELTKRLGELEGDAVVFTPGYFQDGAGKASVPREAAEAVARASAAPAYAPFDTFLGTGFVGGYVPSFEAMGRQVGQLVKAVLDGAPPASLHLPEVTPNTLTVDWRQIRRWGIDESSIPKDAVARFRTRTFTEEHPVMMGTVASVILVQALLITGLVFERRRRHAAERAVAEQRFELAHASRLAVAGELTASIAHEINQPLGAILSNADAADLILDLGGDRRDDLRAILADIRRDDLRASEVIRRLRGMLAKHDVERLPLDVNVAVAEVVAALGAESRRRGLTIDLRLAPETVSMVGDRVQIQQVFFNLLLNAMDALADVPDDRRTIAVSVESPPGRIHVTVRDRGKGIAPEHLPKLFDSFFSTKSGGMGLGLSIARTLVEAHHGRIGVDSRPDEGTSFHVEVPAAAAGLSPKAVP
jgi:signal transduction histidine kinase